MPLIGSICRSSWKSSRQLRLPRCSCDRADVRRVLVETVTTKAEEVTVADSAAVDSAAVDLAAADSVAADSNIYAYTILNIMLLHMV